MDPNTNALVPLPGSTRNLPGGATASPAEISFSPDGSVLLVTEKGTNLIDTFTVRLGIAQAGVSFPSNGVGPFGFEFGLNGAALVSNASGGVSTGSTVTAYKVFSNGNVGVITPALGDTQMAACWLVLARSERFAYVANSASGTLSSYSVAGSGELALLNASAATLANSGVPVDMARSRDQTHLLYVRDGNGLIASFAVGADGSLTPIGSVSGIPMGAQGIAAR
jgi:6-phosphogluconolactonase (cycloisomerase 2 family)